MQFNLPLYLSTSRFNKLKKKKKHYNLLLCHFYFKCAMNVVYCNFQSSSEKRSYRLSPVTVWHSMQTIIDFRIRDVTWMNSSHQCWGCAVLYCELWTTQSQSQNLISTARWKGDGQRERGRLNQSYLKKKDKWKMQTTQMNTVWYPYNRLAYVFPCQKWFSTMIRLSRNLNHFCCTESEKSTHLRRKIMINQFVQFQWLNFKRLKEIVVKIW